MNRFLRCERLQSKWAARMEKRGGSAMASSGLKHGGPGVPAKGRGKLSIQSRELPTGPAVFGCCAHRRIFLFHFCFHGWQSDFCTTAVANAGRKYRTAGAEGGCVAA